MAKSIKVNQEQVKNLGNQVDKLLNTLQECYDNIVKNKQLICDSWQSEAALKFVDNIDKENKSILKLKEAIDADRKFTLDSTERIISVDKDIAKRISEHRA